MNKLCVLISFYNNNFFDTYVASSTNVQSAFIYLFEAQQGQVCMHTVPLPMHNYYGNNRPSIEYYDN